MIWLSSLLLLVGCTVTPIQVREHQPSFDQGTQNSGFYGYDLKGYGYISPHARDRYNALIEVYGKKYSPAIKENDGIGPAVVGIPLFDGGKHIGVVPDGAYRISPEALVRFREMNIWRKTQPPK